jgi:aryl-alcohol dehydrogenase-like predicted oxidoreductase
VPGPIAMQLEYSLTARDIEREHIPAARECNMAVMPWSPLAGGFLTGKYRQDDTGNTGRLSGANPFGNSKFSSKNWDILEVLRAVSVEQDRPMAEIALAWVMARPGVTSTLVGASNVAQLEGNLAAMDVLLTDDQVKRLNYCSAVIPGFTDSLASPAIRRMVFGGNDVRAWGE